MRRTVVSLAILFAAAAGPAAGQQVTSYPRSFFAGAQPYSALDMLRRVPGFTLDAGDDDVRGLSGSAGNVLIDGERPTTKEDLEDLLARLPAADVERIDVIRGGAPGIDMLGQSMVANIVRRRGARISGQAELGAAGYEDGGLAPKARLQASMASGARLTEVSLQAERTPDDEGGEGRRRRVARSGALLRDADYDARGRTDAVELKGGVQGPAMGGRGELRLSWERERFGSRTREARRFPDAAVIVQHERERLDRLEAGVRLDRPLLGGELAVVGLQRLGRSREEETLAGDAPERFRSRARTGETALAATIQRQLSTDLQAQLGAEGAYNVLDGRASLEEADGPVALPGAQVRVEEVRGELSAAATWRAAPRVLVDAGLRLEASELRHSEGDLSKTFVFAKPRLLVSLDAPGGLEARLRLEREVGQLDFEDFASTASLISDNVTTGNADLEPEAKWTFEATLERRILSQGAISITYRQERIDNVLDRVAAVGPDEIFDAPGNLGRGRRRTVSTTFTAPLDRLGLKGGLLSGEVAWVSSSVRDPTTGRRRRISGDERIEGDLRFSQDLPKWRFRWGVEVALPEEEAEFRFDEAQLSRTGAWVDAFAEYGPAPGWRVRLDAGNLTARRVRLRRDVHDGARDAAALAYAEDRRLRFGRSIGVTIRRSY